MDQTSSLIVNLIKGLFLDKERKLLFCSFLFLKDDYSLNYSLLDILKLKKNVEFNLKF